MRVRWVAQYSGGDPANCRRKVARLLAITAEGEAVTPSHGGAHRVEFFSELNASSWQAAVVEVMDIAERYCPRWEMTLAHRQLSGTSLDRNIQHVEYLWFDLRDDSGKNDA